MLAVTGINGQTEMLTDYKEVKRKRRVNGEHSLSLYLLNTDQVKHAYHLVDKRAKITDANGDEYIVLGINKRGHYGKVITAVHIFFDDMMDWQYNVRNGYTNFVQCMDFIFGGTRWKWINQGAFAATDFQNFGDDTRASLTQTALNRYEAEIQIDNKAKTAIFKNQIGKVTDAQFRYGHNLKTFEEDTDMSNFATVIRGYGKDHNEKEIMVEYESPMAKIYGRIHQKPIRDEKYKSKETLLEACKREINDVPDTRFKTSIATLLENGLSPLHKFDVGDYVYMLYEEAGVTVQIRVIEIEDDPTNPTKSPIIELSTFKELKTMSAIQAQFQQTQKQVQQLLDDGGNLNLALKRLYMNTQVFNDHTGMWMIDPDDPNRYAHHGAGGSDYHKGMIRIERDDGYPLIIDGKVNFDMAISAHEPPFMGPGVEINAGWYATKNTEWTRCNFYTFKHTGRYLVFAFSYAAGNGGQVRIRDNNGTVLWSVNHNKTLEDDYYFNAKVDIGVPTGEMKYILLEQASNSAEHMSYVRVLSKWQEG
ncbi:phage tail protein [Bacillus mycoides]|uniref:phage tail protein n=1 Tax=Bacillus mycoides TaxID=1405 RepID=UPI0011A3D4C2|nr:phage tail protein [Bacillus mycoides]